MSAPTAGSHDYGHAKDTYFSKLPDRPPLTLQQRAKTPPVEHPMVRTHPVAGRKALYLNPGFTKAIVGMPEEESRPALEFLFRHATRPEFTCRHRWQVHGMMFCDSRGRQSPSSRRAARSAFPCA
jgi:taurine dioxygenase